MAAQLPGSSKVATPASRNQLIMVASLTAVISCAALAAGFWCGRTTTPSQTPPPWPLMAAAASSNETMAVASGPISNDAEGVFFLDFITGDLQCLVYYPRAGAFGAHYVTNVRQSLGGGGKNSQYIMVTGQAVRAASTGGAQPASSLVYVTDTNSGVFAAYAIPWDRTAESSSRVQTGKMVYVGGGPIRNFQLNQTGQDKPAAIVDPNRK